MGKGNLYLTQYVRLNLIINCVSVSKYNEYLTSIR